MKLQTLNITTEMARTAWITTLLGKPEIVIQQETKQLLLDLMDIVEQSDLEYYVVCAFQEIEKYCKCECKNDFFNEDDDPTKCCNCNPKCKCATSCGCSEKDCADCNKMRSHDVI